MKKFLAVSVALIAFAGAALAYAAPPIEAVSVQILQSIEATEAIPWLIVLSGAAIAATIRS